MALHHDLRTGAAASTSNPREQAGPYLEVDGLVGELDEEPAGCVGGISLGAPSAFNWSAVRLVP